MGAIDGHHGARADLLRCTRATSNPGKKRDEEVDEGVTARSNVGPRRDDADVVRRKKVSEQPFAQL